MPEGITEDTAAERAEWSRKAELLHRTELTETQQRIFRCAECILSRTMAEDGEGTLSPREVRTCTGISQRVVDRCFSGWELRQFITELPYQQDRRYVGARSPTVFMPQTWKGQQLFRPQKSPDCTRSGMTNAMESLRDVHLDLLSCLALHGTDRPEEPPGVDPLALQDCISMGRISLQKICNRMEEAGMVTLVSKPRQETPDSLVGRRYELTPESAAFVATLPPSGRCQLARSNGTTMRQAESLTAVYRLGLPPAVRPANTPDEVPSRWRPDRISKWLRRQVGERYSQQRWPLASYNLAQLLQARIVQERQVFPHVFPNSPASQLALAEAERAGLHDTEAARCLVFNPLLFAATTRWQRAAMAHYMQLDLLMFSTMFQPADLQGKLRLSHQRELAPYQQRTIALFENILAGAEE